MNDDSEALVAQAVERMAERRAADSPNPHANLPLYQFDNSPREQLREEISQAGVIGAKAAEEAEHQAIARALDSIEFGLMADCVEQAPEIAAPIAATRERVAADRMISDEGRDHAVTQTASGVFERLHERTERIFGGHGNGLVKQFRPVTNSSIAAEVAPLVNRNLAIWSSALPEDAISLAMDRVNALQDPDTSPPEKARIAEQVEADILAARRYGANGPRHWEKCASLALEYAGAAQLALDVYRGRAKQRAVSELVETLRGEWDFVVGEIKKRGVWDDVYLGGAPTLAAGVARRKAQREKDAR